MSWFPKDLVAVFKENDFLDDGTDRAHRIYFPIFLAAASTILGLKQFAGEPIECFLSADMAKSQSDYVKSYCWASSTYQLLDTDYDVFSLPRGTGHLLPGARRSGDVRSYGDDGKKVFVSYYQWVPMIIAMQAVLFHIPYVIWWTFSKRGGLHLPHLMYGAHCLSKVQTNPVGRKTQRDDAAYILHDYLQGNLTTVNRRGIKSIIPRKMQLTILYLTVKGMYVGNVIFQLACLHTFLQVNIVKYAFHVLNTLFFGQQWVASARFPIRTLCEYQGTPQVLGSLTFHTCHCVLPINLYNDKFYAVIVIMMVALLIMSVLSALMWMFRLKSERMTQSLVRTLVLEKEDRLINGFVKQYLSLDGLFILNLIYKNIGETTAKELATNLFAKYRDAMAEDSASEESDTKQPLVDQPPPQMRCGGCGAPWYAKDEGRNCTKCKGILRPTSSV